MEQMYECVEKEETRERDGEGGRGVESGLTGEDALDGDWGAVGEARDGVRVDRGGRGWMEG
jgi:hypothetical protein